jgi:hypothetical protein
MYNFKSNEAIIVRPKVPEVAADLTHWWPGHSGLTASLCQPSHSGIIQV